jgi:hypothetical protein
MEYGRKEDGDTMWIKKRKKENEGWRYETLNFRMH